jgi:LPS-assembly lipoprotein
LSEHGPGGRRALLRGALGLLALPAAGCGFQPMYGAGGRHAAAGDAEIAANLAATRVNVLPERFGQLLRRRIMQLLGSGTGGPRAARWDLVIGPSVQSEAVGIQLDGTATRVRLTATANWMLQDASSRQAIASGFERTIDAYNIQPNQFFAADVSREAAERRVADRLADDIVMRVALRFRTMRDGTPAAPLVPPVDTPAPMPEVMQPGMTAPRLDPGSLPGGAGVGVGGLGIPDMITR